MVPITVYLPQNVLDELTTRNQGVADIVLDALRAKQGRPIDPEPTGSAPAAPHDLLRLLSRDELEVLTFLNSGLTLAEIAGRLAVSRETVKSRLIAMYRKTAVSSRADLLAILGVSSVEVS